MKKTVIASCIVEGISLTHAFIFVVFTSAFQDRFLELRGFWYALFIFALCHFIFDVTRSIRHAWIDAFHRSIEVQSPLQKVNYKLFSIVCSFFPVALATWILYRKLRITEFNLFFWPMIFVSIASLKAIDESVCIRASPDSPSK